MKNLVKRVLLATALVGTMATPATAIGVTSSGWNSAQNCVYNGSIFYPENGVTAPGPACYTTPDDLSNPRLGTVDSTKTLVDLIAVQQWSPLHPDHYVARDTMATRVLPDDAPLDPDSAKITANIGALVDTYVTSQFKGWFRTGANVGDGVHANDNIPLYTVDSSNPYQNFENFSSTDARVTNFPGIVHYNSGMIPVPENFRPSSGGDHAAAIFDVATGIQREYFGLSQDASGNWKYASSGYWHGDKEKLTAGDNYSLGLVQGTSSVVGISNSLTQIGIEEVKRGSINHMISVTFPNYNAGPSYPAKLSDGNYAGYAPKAGQIFTIPNSFDVDAWAAANKIDPITVMKVKAIQTYGGIVTDRNFWTTAFNFEHPYGMGQTTNPWKTDPVASVLMNQYRPNNFPWDKVVWLAENYAEVDENNIPDVQVPEPIPVVAPTYPVINESNPIVAKQMAAKQDAVRSLLEGVNTTPAIQDAIQEVLVDEATQTMTVEDLATIAYAVSDHGVLEVTFKMPWGTQESDIQPLQWAAQNDLLFIRGNRIMGANSPASITMLEQYREFIQSQI